MVTALIVVFCLFASVSSQELRASVLFNQGGVTGWMAFTQQDSGGILIETNIRSERDVGGWHVHNFPVDFTIDPAERCYGTGGHFDPSDRFSAATNYSNDCSERTPLQCEAGDLSGKFGCLVTAPTAGIVSYMNNDDELQLQGRYNIIGRSVVIHNRDNSRLACGNIVIDDDNANILVATFVSPIAGSIYFRQSTTRREIGTFIFANLFYVNGETSTSRNHNWHIHVNQPGYRYVMGNCSEVGPHYNPVGVDVSDPNYATYCNPSNISSCEVGDLSNKLGTINIAGDPNRPNRHAWTDANLHMYDIVDRSIAIHAAERGSPIIACAPLIQFSSLQAVAHRPPDASVFSLSQRSPFDPTMVTATVNLSAGEYQINRDGNIRTENNDMCYSDMVLSPFELFPNVSTEDGFALGDISGKYGSSFTEGDNFNSDYFPLFNRYSTLGHNLMIDQSSNVSCGTLNPSGSINIVRAWVNFASSMMNGWITFRQVLTTQADGSYSTGPTLVNYRFNYRNATEQTDGHNWHVHSQRTGTDGPTPSCDIVQGHYNPYGVDLASNYPELCNSSDITQYPLRCEVGDLSGKHGRLSIRAADSPERTLVFYDPNLPLVGPYTILGRSIAVHVNNAAPIMACSNIEPAVLSDTALQLSFPDLPSDAMDPKIAVPIAIVELLNNSNVMHGEILAYDVNVAADINGTVSCTIVTLRFTEFTGDDSTEDLVRLVRALNQDDLPPQYRSGVCPMLDLTGESITNTTTRPTPKPKPDSAVNVEPLPALIGAFVALVALILFNIA